MKQPQSFLARQCVLSFYRPETGPAREVKIVLQQKPGRVEDKRNHRPNNKKSLFALDSHS